MKRENNKFYVIWRGRQIGIYDSWDACEKQVENYPHAAFLSFSSLEEAQRAFQSSYAEVLERRRAPHSPHGILPIGDSFCVDASCRGNPGIMEYQCVHTTSRELIFHAGPYLYGTNNIGEFLAIVHALYWLKGKDWQTAVYTDSEIALKWIEKKKCHTKEALKNKNNELWNLVQCAEEWLAKNQYPNQILKWRTDLWGENVADFHRK